MSTPNSSTAEAYKLAKEIAGGEQYIISAVMHADERNREASDRLGRDVFHYHLHIVYLPVVEKQNPLVQAVQGPCAARHRAGDGHAGQPQQKVAD